MLFTHFRLKLCVCLFSLVNHHVVRVFFSIILITSKTRIIDVLSRPTLEFEYLKVQLLVHSILMTLELTSYFE